MRADTRAFVEDCWAEIFGCGRNDLWVGTQVNGHAGLGEYPGVWVAWRDAGVHVSLPTTVTPHEAESLATQGIETLADPAWWSTFAADRGWVLVGPAVHAYLDEDPGNDGTVSRIDPETNDVVETIDVGNAPSGLAFADGRVWLTVQAP